VIDVGGGASVLADRPLLRGFIRLTVLDISAAALRASQARLGAEARRVRWIEADVTECRPGVRYAVWHGRAVFHFLTEANDRRRYVAALKAALRPGARTIIAAFELNGPEKYSGLPVVRYDAAKLLAQLGPGFRLLEERTECHISPAGRGQAFVYFRLEYAPET